ncbi:MAG: DMT family transporter [Planctomycetaceae bacterium]|nr:DMT family transporter [Planctomycetaceae bacterium]
MVVLGILMGLGCALAQSFGYIFSRRFVLHHRGGPLRLLVLAHVIMGVAAAAALPFFWPRTMPPLSVWAWPVIAMTGFYLMGQMVIFLALQRVEASKVAPLLGLKVPILAILAVAAVNAPPPLHDFAAFMGITQAKSPVGLQWLGVALAVAAAMALCHHAGQWLSLKVIAAIVFVCITYSLSDLNIIATQHALANTGASPAILSACICYVLCGVMAAVTLPWLGTRNRGAWIDAAPFAGCWLVAMILFFACLAQVSAIFGNILQSTRGLLSIVVGAATAHIGLLHLEGKMERWAFVRRVIAAMLMVGAIALYAAG